MTQEDRIKRKIEKKWLKNKWFELKWGRYHGDLNFGNSKDKCDLSIQIVVDGKTITESVEGVGQFDTYFKVIKKALIMFYTKLKNVRLVSYSVPKIVVAEDGSAAPVKTLIELQYNGEPLTFEYESGNIGKAGVYALVEGFATCLDRLYL